MRWLLLPLWVLFWSTCALEDRCRGPCGRRPRAPSHGGPVRAKGGINTLPGTWPWVISIQLPEGEDFRHWCGGSLVNSLWIVTAAHCFVLTRYIKVEFWRVVVGATRLTHPTADTQILSIRRLVEHPNYNRIGYLNDIALIELSEPVDCNNYVQPACLPDESLAISSLGHCYFGGWGPVDVMKDALKREVLQEIQVNLLGSKLCNSSRWYYTRVKESNLCALAEGGQENCLGDRGGPLMCRERRSERFWVVGINSWGSGCTETQRPNVFTSTQRFHSWIRQISRERSPPSRRPQKPKHKPGSQPSTQRPMKYSSSRPKPVSVAVTRPMGLFRPRPNLSWGKPNYIPLPSSQLPTRQPTAATGSWNQQGLSRPPLRPWWRPGLTQSTKPTFPQRPPSLPASQALHNWTQGLPGNVKPQRPSLTRPQMVSQQFQNWTAGGPNTFIRNPRPKRKPPFLGAAEPGAGEE